MLFISRFLSVLLMMSGAAWGANSPGFDVSIDRNSMGMDESLSLRFSIRVEGSADISDPKFEAPDFDEVNQYTSVFVESFYENGKFGVRNNRRLTKVLRPKKSGTLTISGIQVVVNGKTLQHTPFEVQVMGTGQGTPPPPRYGGSGMGLRGVGKTVPQLPFTVRVELDRTRAYKGQQVVVSYYLYRRSKVFNVQVQKYPILDGFLREDLDLPILGQRLDSESVVVDGVAFERSLLARYAAYPLKEGKLPIDSMTIKGNYYPGSDPQLDINNPIQSFFQQMQPREWSHRSDRVELEVAPLPSEGRPPSFTGGVGDFTLESAVDKKLLKANDALTLTLKVEGTGNIGAIGEPKVNWPKDIEVFETKSRVLPARAGVSTKVFEVLAIPRRPGKWVLPAAELSFFSIKDRAYRTVRGPDFEIEVLEGLGESSGSSPVAGLQNQSSQNLNQDRGVVFLLPEQWSQKGKGWITWALKGILALLGLTGVLLVGALLRRGVRKWRMLKAYQGTHGRAGGADTWSELQRFASGDASRAPWSEVVSAYDLLSQRMLEQLEEVIALPARALSRDELYRQAIERGLGEESLWKRVCLVLEYCEWVRFGSSAGMVTQPEARSQLSSWLTEASRVLIEVEKASQREEAKREESKRDRR